MQSLKQTRQLKAGIDACSQLWVDGWKFTCYMDKAERMAVGFCTAGGSITLYSAADGHRRGRVTWFQQRSKILYNLAVEVISRTTFLLKNDLGG